MTRRAYLAIISGLVPLIMAASCRTEAEQAQRTIVTPVKLAPVVKQEIAKTLNTYGRLSAKQEIKLSFKVGGIIRKFFVDEGQAVNKGELLARLDLSEIESQVQQARSAFEKAQRDLERVENLYKEKAATLEQFQNVQTAYQVAQSQLKTAEFNLRYSEIHAPAQGKILKRLMEVNEMVGAGMPVLFFASTDNDWVVRVGVSDRDLVRLRLNDPATVRFDAYPDDEFQAYVAETVESADPLTGTYEVELRVVPGGKRLVSGFVAKVDITPSQKSPYFIIPVEALVQAEGNQAYVFTVNANFQKAERLLITIGFLFDDKVAVASGLEGVRHVVTEGAAYLVDGAEVDVIRDEDSVDGFQAF